MSDFPQTSFPSPDDDPTNPVRTAILQAAAVGAQKAAGSSVVDARDFKDYMDGVLLAAQAYATFDPERMAGGETPETRLRATPVTPSDHDRDGKLGEKS